MLRAALRVMWICAGLIAASDLGVSQVMLGRGPDLRLIQEDQAVLGETGDRRDLPCDVIKLKPQLGFDMRFHAGYVVSVPLKEIAGAGGRLRLLLRITPFDRPENSTVFSDRFSVPPIEEPAKGEAYLPGEYTLGAGRYQVDWLMRDSEGRVCSSHWEIEAKRSSDAEDLTIAMPDATVGERPEDPFRESPPVTRDQERPLYAKLLVNFSPGDPSQAGLNPRDVEALASILRAIAQEPGFDRFSLVAFSMTEERVLYRQGISPRIDFPALRGVVKEVKPGTVSIRQLEDRDSGARFLAGLLAEPPAPQEPRPDAIIVVSPCGMFEDNPRQPNLGEGALTTPVFYINYEANPRRHPWRDAIGIMLKAYRALEYSITKPRDLGSAVGDMMSRLHPGNR